MKNVKDAPANVEYKDVVADINELLVQIKQATHDAGSYQTISWGHVGSAKHVKHLLMEILMFQTMTGVNDSEDEFLSNLDKELKAKRGAK